MRLQPYSEVMERLREKREDLGVQQNELADRIGVSPSTLNRMEKGTLETKYNTVYEVWRQLDQLQQDDASDVMASTVTWANPDDTHREIARRVDENNFDQLPVREDGEFVGWITSRALAANNDPNKPVRELMVKSSNAELFGTVSHDTDREEVRELLDEEYQALLVVDDDDEYIGIITYHDLL